MTKVWFPNPTSPEVLPNNEKAGVEPPNERFEVLGLRTGHESAATITFRSVGETLVCDQSIQGC